MGHRAATGDHARSIDQRRDGSVLALRRSKLDSRSSVSLRRVQVGARASCGGGVGAFRSGSLGARGLGAALGCPALLADLATHARTLRAFPRGSRLRSAPSTPFIREVLAMSVDRSITAEQTVSVLEALLAERGAPQNELSRTRLVPLRSARQARLMADSGASRRCLAARVAELPDAVGAALSAVTLWRRCPISGSLRRRFNLVQASVVSLARCRFRAPPRARAAPRRPSACGAASATGSAGRWRV